MLITDCFLSIADESVAIDAVRQSMPVILDLPGAKRKEQQSSSKELKSSSRKGKKGARRVSSGRTRLSIEEDATKLSSTISDGRRCIRSALYFAYLSYPDQSLDYVSTWVEDQLQEETMNIDSVPSSCLFSESWIKSATKRLESLTGIRQKRKRGSIDPKHVSSTRRSSRQSCLTPAALESIIDKPTGQDDGSGKTLAKSSLHVSNTEATSISLGSILVQDVMILFHQVLVTEGKQADKVDHEISNNPSPGKSKHSSKYSINGRRCVLDEAVASALHLFTVPFIPTKAKGEWINGNSNTGVNSLTLLRHRACTFLLNVARRHPSLWMLRYAEMVVQSLSSALSISPSLIGGIITISKSPAINEREQWVATTPLFRCLLDSYEICLQHHALATFLCSLRSSHPANEDTVNSDLQVSRDSGSFVMIFPLRLLGAIALKQQEWLQVRSLLSLWATYLV